MMSDVDNRTRSALACGVGQNAFALILLIAACLKAQELSSLWNGTALAAKSLACFEIGIEWVLALWLLSGISRIRARRATICLLLVFIVVSGWRLFMGRADCGCFGNVHVHPAITLTLDVTVLAVIRWFGRGNALASSRLCQTIRWGFLRFNRLTIAATVSVALPAAILIPHGEGKRTVFIDPHEWLDKPCPLLDWVDAASRDDLARGRRSVVLFSHDCDTCRKYLPELAKQSASELATIRIIDIATDLPSDSEGTAFSLRRLPLRTNIRLVGAVPLRIDLQDGIVQAADSPLEH